MKIFKSLRQTLSQRTLRLFVKCYSEIEKTPLDNWVKCQNGDIIWIYPRRFSILRLEKVTRRIHKKGIVNKKDLIRFEALQDQYIERYDLREGMIEFLKIKIALTQLRLMYIETGDKMLLNQIEIETENLKKADPSNIEGMTIDQSLAWLRTQMPAWIDKKTITVTEWRDLMDEYGRRNKKE